MKQKRKHRDRLLLASEALAMSLLFDATEGRMGKAPNPLKEGIIAPPPIEFKDKRALLDSITKLMQLKHTVDPEEEPEDGLSSYRERLNGSFDTETGSRGAFPEAASGKFEPDEFDKFNAKNTE